MDFFSERNQRVAKNVGLVVLFVATVVVPLGILLNAGLLIASVFSPAGITVLPREETLLAVHHIAGAIFFSAPVGYTTVVAMFAVCYGCIARKPTVVDISSAVALPGLALLTASLFAHVLVLYFYQLA